MKVIISCCDGKNGNAFTHNQKTINFVSHVNEVMPDNSLCFHPDDLIPNENTTWREKIAQQEVRDDLTLAYNLYRPNIYRLLYEHYLDNLFIFSAGWGIIRADYKLPKYDVTFSSGDKIATSARRSLKDIFRDFNHLDDQIKSKTENLIFIAPKAYVLPFCRLTEHLPNKKVIYYFGKPIKNKYCTDSNFEFSPLPFRTNNNRKWHYEFAEKLISQEIEL